MADGFAKLGAWAKTHRTGVLAGGGAGVAGLAYVIRKRSAAGASGSGSSLANVPASSTVDPATGAVTGFGISGPDFAGMLLGQQSAFQSAVQGQLGEQQKLNIARLTGIAKQRRQQRQTDARAVLHWYAKRYPARRPVAAPRPAPVHPRPGVAALVARRREIQRQNTTLSHPGVRRG